MERLFSPWRSQYIDSFQNENKNQCIFCSVLKSNEDDKNLVIARSKDFSIIMNKYPYNSGHLLVISNTHKADLKDLSDTEKSTFLLFVQHSQQILKHSLHPDGFNIGLNIGRVAGAGVEDHIHFHIVPRWRGDINFMPILSDTKVISDDIHHTMIKLRNSIKELGIKL